MRHARPIELRQTVALGRAVQLLGELPHVSWRNTNPSVWQSRAKYPRAFRQSKNASFSYLSGTPTRNSRGGSPGAGEGTESFQPGWPSPTNGQQARVLNSARANLNTRPESSRSPSMVVPGSRWRRTPAARRTSWRRARTSPRADSACPRSRPNRSQRRPYYPSALRGRRRRHRRGRRRARRAAGA